MTETMTATALINASPEIVFDLLADPATHAAIDGTGWVRQPVYDEHLAATGQIFRMAMYHDNPKSTGAGTTEVTLTYDWSRVPPRHRDIEFPPFGRQHLDNSLKHLAELADRVQA